MIYSTDIQKYDWNMRYSAQRENLYKKNSEKRNRTMLSADKSLCQIFPFGMQDPRRSGAPPFSI